MSLYWAPNSWQVQTKRDYRRISFLDKEDDFTICYSSSSENFAYDLNDEDFEEHLSKAAEKIAKEMYVLSLIPDLGQMNSRQRRLFKRRVLEIAYDIKDNFK